MFSLQVEVRYDEVTIHVLNEIQERIVYQVPGSPLARTPSSLSFGQAVS